MSTSNSQILDGGFETPALAQGGQQGAPSGIAWSFSNPYCGICTATSQPGQSCSNTTAPEGSQYAYLNQSGSATQSVSFAAGTYTISLQACNSTNNLNALTVTIDGTSYGKFTPTNSPPSFQSFVTGQFTVPAGNHTVAINGVPNSVVNDNYVFVDSVVINVATPILTGLTINPPNPTVSATTTEPFTATATYSDGSMTTVTGQVAWSTNLGTITASGGAYTPPAVTNAVQHATITATLSGQTATTNVMIPALVLPTIGPITLKAIAEGTSEEIDYPAIVPGTYGVMNVSLLVGTVSGQEATMPAATNLTGAEGAFTHNTNPTTPNFYIVRATDSQGNIALAPNELTGTVTPTGTGFTQAQLTQLNTSLVNSFSVAFNATALANINQEFAKPTLTVDLGSIGGQAVSSALQSALQQALIGALPNGTSPANGSLLTIIESAVAAIAPQIVNLIPTISLEGGSVAASPAPTASSFSASGDDLTAPSGGFNGMNLLLQSGTMVGISRRIATHTQTGNFHNFVFGTIVPGTTTVNPTPFPAAPAVATSTTPADRFVITP